MQLISDENRNVIELSIYLLTKFVPSPSSYFDKVLFGRAASTSGEDVPTGNDVII